MKKALIAMSGGVDSSVVAYLMKKSGFECTGATMRLFSNGDVGIRSKTCCSLDDVEDAKAVCFKLGIPHYVFNFTDDFSAEIIDKFVVSYINGETPNPCIDCNRYMKFDRLLKRAETLGYDCLVTGHYVRTEEKNGKILLKKAADGSKDQSYVLYNLTQDILRRVAFPLGSLKKSDVRGIAEENGFVNAEKRDSQDICFVPDGNYARVIEERNGQVSEGNFVDPDGKILGRHKGIIRYTVGQRKGLGISSDSPLYVCKILPESNNIVLGKDKELYSKELIAGDFNWISGEVPERNFRAKAKIRYKQQEKDASVTVLDDGNVKIIFDEPQRAVTRGQAAVLYDGDTVLGGGRII